MAYHGGDGEKSPDSGYILKVKLTEFADELDVECERKGASRMIKVLSLKNWKNGAPWEQKTQQSRVRDTASGSVLGYITCGGQRVWV
jgi:hypothetical protein